MKRIDRSILETIEFLNKNDWDLCPFTVKMIKDSDKIKDFYSCYVNCTKEKLDKIVNFFWKKQYEIGTFGRFWDDDIYCDYGYYRGFDYLVDEDRYKYYIVNEHGESKNFYENFEPLTEIPKYKGEK